MVVVPPATALPPKNTPGAAEPPKLPFPALSVKAALEAPGPSYAPKLAGATEIEEEPFAVRPGKVLKPAKAVPLIGPPTAVAVKDRPAGAETVKGTDDVAFVNAFGAPVKLKISTSPVLLYASVIVILVSVKPSVGSKS